jgi:hypothetical protein
MPGSIAKAATGAPNSEKQGSGTGFHVEKLPDRNFVGQKEAFRGIHAAGISNTKSIELFNALDSAGLVQLGV